MKTKRQVWCMTIACVSMCLKNLPKYEASATLINPGCFGVHIVNFKDLIWLIVVCIVLQYCICTTWVVSQWVWVQWGTKYYVFVRVVSSPVLQIFELCENSQFMIYSWFTDLQNELHLSMTDISPYQQTSGWKNGIVQLRIQEGQGIL